MSMLTLTGQLLNIFEAPKGVSKKTGEEYGGGDKIQILGDVDLPNGGKKKDLITLGTHNIEFFKHLVGKDIRVPVGAFPLAKSVQFFIPEGSKPDVIKSQITAAL